MRQTNHTLMPHSVSKYLHTHRHISSQTPALSLIYGCVPSRLTNASQIYSVDALRWSLQETSLSPSKAAPPACEWRHQM